MCLLNVSFFIYHVMSRTFVVFTSLLFYSKSCSGVSEVRGIVNVKCVRDGYQTVQAALLDYTLTCYPTIQVGQLFEIIVRPICLPLR